MKESKMIITLTGGTGSFGSCFVHKLLKDTDWIIRIFSRDEHKQEDLRNKIYGSSLSTIPEYMESRVRFFIGDIRDKDRLTRALEGSDYVVHAAALKQVQSCEYSPNETAKTNIFGTMNLIEACLDCAVDKALLISTDKAVSPLNLYGSTKMVAERLWTQANSYSGKGGTKFVSTRYGNVVGSRGTIVDLFTKLKEEKKEIPITNLNATRFWITLQEANQFVLDHLVEEFQGGEIFVPILPSVRIVDVAKAIYPESSIKVIGERPGDKLHELLFSDYESKRTLIKDKYFVIEPLINSWGYEKSSYFKRAKKEYSSDQNEFLSIDQIKESIYGVPA